MEKTMKIVLAFLLSLLMAPMALAQPTGPNGGILGGSGDHQTELVVTPTELTVYIIEHGKAHSTKGTSLRAVVQQGGKSTTVALVDVEGKKLVGKLDAPLGAGAIVVVTGKDDHGAVLTGRFTIK
jgi:hypothetical protein